MHVIKDSADITTYFVLRDSTNHAPKTDVTITDIDLYYVSHRAAMSAKADATALAAADSAHADNQAYHVGQGVYRIDWPDIWSGNVGTTVQLVVVCSGVDTTVLEVEIVGPAQTGDAYARLGAPAGASLSADVAAVKTVVDTVQADTDLLDDVSGGLADIHSDVAAVKSDTAAILADTAELQTNQGNWLTATGFSKHSAADVWTSGTRTLSSYGSLVADIATAVWGAAARTLTAISDSSGITTLLTRISAALSFTGGNVHAHVKAKDNLDFGALEKTSLNAATPAVTVSDKTGFSLATAPPTAAQIRAEIDSNSTQLAAIVADTSEIQAELADGGRTDLLVDAIKAKTDKLTFTSGNDLDANVQKINDVALTGDGSATPWGPA